MVKVEFLEMWAKPFHKKSTHVASVQKASVFDHRYDEWEGGICVVLQHNLFGGEANWGLISGWETAKLEIKKFSSEGEQLEKKKRRLWSDEHWSGQMTVQWIPQWREGPHHPESGDDLASLVKK